MQIRVKKNDKMTGKVSEMLQNDYMACYLHKNSDEMHYNDNHCTLIGVLD